MTVASNQARIDEQRGLQAEVDRMTIRFAQQTADGTLSGRRGLYQHHARVLRQAEANLADRERMIAREAR